MVSFYNPAIDCSTLFCALEAIKVLKDRPVIVKRAFEYLKLLENKDYKNYNLLFSIIAGGQWCQVLHYDIYSLGDDRGNKNLTNSCPLGIASKAQA